MNAKEIKALNWHKKSLIDALIREGKDVGDINITLENIIRNLDKERINKNPINKAHVEGYAAGYDAGLQEGEFKRCDRWAKIFLMNDDEVPRSY